MKTSQKALAKLLKRDAKNSRVQALVDDSDMSISEVLSTCVNEKKKRLVLHHLCKSGRLSLVTFVFSMKKGWRDGKEAIRTAVLAKDFEGNTPAHVAALKAYSVAKKKDPAVYSEAARKIEGKLNTNLYSNP
jgi:hypothetical protein